LNYREYFQEVGRVEAGGYRYPGPPYRLSETPCRVVRPAPTLGQHNQEILGGQLGISEAELAGLVNEGTV
jgi:crotonobetainyl-CoA:carnitine CoA-transferase CaiB-like acyl-CoA transferase